MKKIEHRKEAKRKSVRLLAQQKLPIVSELCEWSGTFEGFICKMIRVKIYV